MLRLIRLGVFIFISWFSIGQLWAQKGTEVGGWLGTSFYFGDLNTNFSLADPGLAGGLIGRYNFDERISIKTSLNYANIRGNDTDSQNSFERARALNFKSHIFDLSSHVEFNFFPYIHGHKEKYFTPYLLMGAAVSRFNPRADYLDPDLGEMITVNLHPLGTEGQFLGEEYSRIAPAFTIGGGFKFDLSRDWSVNIEIATRMVFTDYLDDVSGTYADPALIDGMRPEVGGLRASAIADPSSIGQSGRQRGNNRDNDNYTFVGVSIMRYFGTLQCPKPATIF